MKGLVSIIAEYERGQDFVVYCSSICILYHESVKLGETSINHLFLHFIQCFIFPLSFILDSFYCCVLKFINGFSSTVSNLLLMLFIIFHCSHSFPLCNFHLAFIYIFHLFNKNGLSSSFLNIWNIGVLTF